MSDQPPKYALPEIERRWLVDRSALPSLDACARRRIEDKYLHGGRLRLRKIIPPVAEPIYKLGKKYPSPAGMREHVVNVYLSAEEFDLLFALPGRVARKTRYTVERGSVDVYEHPASSPTIFEAEFASEEDAASYRPPSFAGEEITGDARYSGFALAAAP
jgi:CYTH domain-containing protein